MIEKISQKGMFVSWPTAEATQGTGGEMSSGVQTLSHLGSDYLYLPFAKNGINYAASAGCDVISYNFTGCIMATYTTGGQRRVCHVSTGDGQDCKAAWDAIKAQASNVVEFRPHEGIDLPPGHSDAWGCYGLITSDSKCFSITVGRPQGSAAWVVTNQRQFP